jgi:hypothetical protein
MELCRDTTGSVYDWVISNLSRYEPGLQIPNHLTVAARDKGIIYAGIVYSRIGHICWMTIYAASPIWATRGNISKIIDIAVTTGSTVAKCATNIKNKKINKLLSGLGFHRDGVMRYARPSGKHEIVWSITRHELKSKRWYKK